MPSAARSIARWTAPRTILHPSPIADSFDRRAQDQAGLAATAAAVVATLGDLALLRVADAAAPAMPLAAPNLAHVVFFAASRPAVRPETRC